MIQYWNVCLEIFIVAETAYQWAIVLTSVFLNRSIVDLQYQFQVYSKLIELSIYFSDYFCIQVILRYCIQFPVLYSKSLLLIYFIYSSLYLLVPNSQCILSSTAISKKKIISQSKFIFTVKLVEKYRVLIYPTASTQKPPHYQHPPPEGTFVITDECSLSLKSIISVRIHSWYCTFYEF